MSTGSHLNPHQGRRLCIGIIPLNQVVYLISYLEQVDPSIYLDEMQHLSIRVFSRYYSVGRICTTLIRNKITRKKLSLIADRQNEEEKRMYREFMAQFTATQRLYLDEASICPQKMVSAAWARAGPACSRDPRNAAGPEAPLCCCIFVN